MEMRVPHNALHILQLLEAAGFKAYVVGGCVRDALLGRTPSDWDITTSALPMQTKATMAAAGVKTSDTGIKHGTVTVIIDGQPFETTTFRSDGAYSDSRHPDNVEFLADVDGDLARRDFTVNAMAYSPMRGFVDVFGGQADLASGVLRAVGCPHERFAEDALRIMRALRFSAQLEFSVEPATAAALHTDAGLLNSIAVERIWAEFAKLLVAPGAVSVMREFRDVIAVVIPELEPCFDFDQQNPFHAYDVWEHTLHALAAAPPEFGPAERLALLLHDVGKPACFTKTPDGIGHALGHAKVSAQIAHDVCKRLHTPCAVAESCEHLVRYHMFDIPETPRAMRRFLLKHGEQGARTLFKLRVCDVAGMATERSANSKFAVAFQNAQRLMEEELAKQAVFGLKDLAIGGRDLIEAGIGQGPEIGRILNGLLAAVVDGDVPNEREALLSHVSALR